MNNNKIKNKKNKATTWKQDLHIAINQVYYKWKVITVTIATYILIKLHMILIDFNTNLGNIPFLQNFNNLTIKHIPVLGDVNITHYIIHAFSIILSILMIYGFYRLLKALSKPLKTKKITKTCKELEIYYGEKSESNLPMPIKETKDKENSNLRVMELYSNGTTQEEWEKDNRLARMSQKLNRAVVGVEPHETDIDKMLLYYRKDYSKQILYWSNDYLIKDDCTLILGQNQLGRQEIINLNDNPHLVIAGGSGSGKSVELLCLLMQNILKGNKVIVGEFSKGGVDFSKEWKNLVNFEIYTEPEQLGAYFAYELSHELTVRKELLNLYDCENISEYNQKVATGEIKGEPLQRIIIALDEAGQIFTKSKNENKEKTLKSIREIINELFSTYRYCGINAILATQVPSASILTEEIRYNSYRICGKANKILSEMAIDSPKASTIPKNSKGHFYTNEGKEFQGYLFLEKEVFKNQKKQGVDNIEYTANN